MVFNFIYDFFNKKKFLNFELNVSVFAFIVSVFGVIFRKSSRSKSLQTFTNNFFYSDIKLFNPFGCYLKAWCVVEVQMAFFEMAT